MRPELVPGAFQLFSTFNKIIELTVLNNDNTVVFILYGLFAAVEVNNAQARMSQSNIPVKKQACFIGPPAAESMCHKKKNFFPRFFLKINISANTAHGL